MRRILHSALFVSCLALAGCHGGSGRSDGPIDGPPRQDFRLGGSTGEFRGMLGLVNNGSDSLRLREAGQFVFPQRLAHGQRYEVEVFHQPPAQVCEVLHGSGSAGADVDDLRVPCLPAQPRPWLALGGQAGEGTYPSGTPIQDPRSGLLYWATARGGADGHGAVMQAAPGGQASVLHSFAGGAGGSSPARRLVLRDGALYGITSDGGAHSDGLIYRLGLQGQFSVIHSFSGSVRSQGVDGRHARSPLVAAANGSLYGTTWGGGSHDSGTIYRVDPAGTYRVVYSFHAHLQQAAHRPTGALLAGPDGLLYGTADYGGAQGNGGVFRFDPRRDTLQVIAALPRAAEHDSHGVALAADGSLYGVAGGEPGLLFRVPPDAPLQVLHDFGQGADGRAPRGQLLQASDGWLYGVTDAGGSHGQGTLYRFDPVADTEQVLYDFGSQPQVGVQPTTGLLLAANGWLIGTTPGSSRAGSAHPGGTLYLVP